MSFRDDVNNDPPQDAIQESDAEDLYEHAPCGYISTRMDGTIIRANRTFLDWTGYEAEDIVGRKRFDELLTPGGRIYHETHYAPLLRLEGSAREIALEILAADGTRLAALVNSVVKLDDRGEQAIVRSAIFEAANRREYERELVRARHSAEETEAQVRVLAETLQASLIPPAPPQIPAVDVGAAYRPAGTGGEVGGDFFDVFEIARNDWAVVIGDVIGKGAQAATITALARYTVRAAAMQVRQPRRVLGLLNEAMLRQHPESFCTVAYARVRTNKEGRVRVTIALGGHPLPLLSSEGRRPEPVGRPGTVIGVISDPPLRDQVIDLQPGDVLTFFTDGVTEGRSGDEFYGEERLAELILRERDAGAGDIAERIVADVVDFQKDLPRDDIAVTVLKVPTA